MQAATCTAAAFQTPHTVQVPLSSDLISRTLTRKTACANHIKKGITDVVDAILSLSTLVQTECDEGVHAYEFVWLHKQVGYNNEQQYWLAKNSYGSSWGDRGLFKVGACSMR
jgi:hypothetical protein